MESRPSENIQLATSAEDFTSSREETSNTLKSVLDRSDLFVPVPPSPVMIENTPPPLWESVDVSVLEAGKEEIPVMEPVDQRGDSAEAPTSPIEAINAVPEPVRDLMVVEQGRSIWRNVADQLKARIESNPEGFGIQAHELSDSSVLNKLVSEKTLEILKHNGFIDAEGNTTGAGEVCEGDTVLLNDDGTIEINSDSQPWVNETAITAQEPSLEDNSGFSEVSLGVGVSPLTSSEVPLPNQNVLEESSAEPIQEDLPPIESTPEGPVDFTGEVGVVDIAHTTQLEPIAPEGVDGDSVVESVLNHISTPEEVQIDFLPIAKVLGFGGPDEYSGFLKTKVEDFLRAVDERREMSSSGGSDRSLYKGWKLPDTNSVILLNPQHMAFAEAIRSLGLGRLTQDMSFEEFLRKYGEAVISALEVRK